MGRYVSLRNRVHAVGLTDTGKVREHNEDSIALDGDIGLFVLADGMGGYNAGEVASGIAVNVVSTGMLPELASGRELSKVDVQSGLSHAALLLQQQIAAANKGIYDAAQARPECAGMGTTIVAAVFFANRVSIGHIGDSRCYRWRGGSLQQLTRDHSLLQEQIDAGLLTPEEALYAPNRNLVTRALGVEPRSPLGDDVMASLFEPDGPAAPGYLLTQNYRVILEYNCSNYYAMSVGLLADEISR